MVLLCFRNIYSNTYFLIWFRIHSVIFPLFPFRECVRMCRSIVSKLCFNTPLESLSSVCWLWNEFMEQRLHHCYTQMMKIWDYWIIWKKCVSMNQYFYSVVNSSTTHIFLLILQITEQTITTKSLIRNKQVEELVGNEEIQKSLDDGRFKNKYLMAAIMACYSV